jgi:hypothetical protein
VQGMGPTEIRQVPWSQRRPPACMYSTSGLTFECQLAWLDALREIERRLFCFGGSTHQGMVLTTVIREKRWNSSQHGEIESALAAVLPPPVLQTA